MPDFRIKVAEQTVDMKSLHDGVARLCKDYMVAGAAEDFAEGTGAREGCTPCSDGDPANVDGACDEPAARSSDMTASGMPMSSQGSRGSRDSQNPQADLSIVVTQAMIDAERERDPDGANFSDSYLETLVVQRAISDWLPAHGAFLMHGAVIAYHGEGVAFCAPSGVGKSTHIRHWAREFGEDVQIVNGDKPFVRPAASEANTTNADGADDVSSRDAINADGTDTECAADSTAVTSKANASNAKDAAGTTGAPGGATSPSPLPMAYGTPWAGKEGWQRNCAVPLRAICLLGRMDASTDEASEFACVREVEAASVLERVLAQVYMPPDAQACFETLGLVDAMLGAVKVYDVKVANDARAAIVVRDAIFKEQT